MYRFHAIQDAIKDIFSNRKALEIERNLIFGSILA